MENDLGLARLRSHLTEPEKPTPRLFYLMSLDVDTLGRIAKEGDIGASDELDRRGLALRTALELIEDAWVFSPHVSSNAVSNTICGCVSVKTARMKHEPECAYAPILKRTKRMSGSVFGRSNG